MTKKVRDEFHVCKQANVYSERQIDWLTDLLTDVACLEFGSSLMTCKFYACVLRKRTEGEGYPASFMFYIYFVNAEKNNRQSL